MFVSSNISYHYHPSIKYYLILQQIPLSAILAEIRSGRTSAFQGIYSWLLARVGNDLDVSPGEEFRIAVKEAQKIGACVVLGDRPLSITLSRLWSALSLWEKCRLLGTLVWTGMSMLDSDEMRSEIEKMKDSDVLTEAIKEVGKDFPSLLGPLITERDQYMTYIMQRLAGKATKVVAVVGAGHLEGIKKHWDSEIDVESISRIPPKKRRLHRGVLLVGFGATGVAAVVFGVSRWRHQHRRD
jgi:pheromone shutdown protein TraB